MRAAVNDLKLDSLGVVHAGPDSFAMSDQVSAIAATDLGSVSDKLR